MWEVPWKIINLISKICVPKIKNSQNILVLTWYSGVLFFFSKNVNPNIVQSVLGELVLYLLWIIIKFYVFSKNLDIINFAF